jgi:O-antigen/teichoic acid export membrane protein
MSRVSTFCRLTEIDSIRADLRSRSIRAVGLTAAAGFADIGLRLASTAVLARMLLPEDFGVVMMVTAVTAIADQLRDLGLSTATVQKKTITHGEVSNLFWINTGAGVVIALIVCALSPLVAAYYRDPRLRLITCVLASNFVFSGLAVQHQALLARTLRLGTSASVRLSSSALSTVVAVFMAWQGYGYWSLIWREVLRSALLAGGMWLCLPWVPGVPSRQISVRGLLRFGADLSAANIIATVGAGADRFLLGRFWGASAVGIYRQAYQLLVVPLDQLLSPAYQVTQPGLSMLQNDPTRYAHFYSKLLTAVCVVTMPLSMFVAVHSNEVVLVLFGAKWIECAPILMILSLGGFIRQAVLSTAIIPITRGKSATYLKLTILSSATFVVLMSLGVNWGTRGLAIASVASDWLLVWPRLRLSLRGSPVGMQTFFRTVARPAVASIGMALILISVRIWTSPSAPLFALSVGGITALAAFCALWLLLPGGKAELFALLADVRAAIVQRRADIDPPSRASGVGVEPIIVANKPATP